MIPFAVASKTESAHSSGPPNTVTARFLARFRWLDTDTAQPLWVQDFSFDNGGTWAPINWRMTHTRL